MFLLGSLLPSLLQHPRCAALVLDMVCSEEVESVGCLVPVFAVPGREWILRDSCPVTERVCPVLRGRGSIQERRFGDRQDGFKVRAYQL